MKRGVVPQGLGVCCGSNVVIRGPFVSFDVFHVLLMCESGDPGSLPTARRWRVRGARGGGVGVTRGELASAVQNCFVIKMRNLMSGSRVVGVAPTSRDEA